MGHRNLRTRITIVSLSGDLHISCTMKSEMRETSGDRGKPDLITPRLNGARLSPHFARLDGMRSEAGSLQLHKEQLPCNGSQLHCFWRDSVSDIVLASFVRS